MNFLLKITNWYFTRDAGPYWCVLLLDCFIVVASSMFVYALSNGTIYTLMHFWPLVGTFCFYLLFYIAGFKVFHTYSGVIRYSSFVDLQHIGYAMLLSTALIILVKWGLNTDAWLMPMRIKVLLYAGFLSTMLMWMMRILVKYLYDVTYTDINAQKAIVYGTKLGGVSIAKSIRNQSPSKYLLKGFLSDDIQQSKHYVMGMKVYYNDASAVEKMQELGIKVLLVSPMKSDALRNNTELVNNLIAAGIHILMLPAAVEWDGKSDLTYTQLKEVDVEDLLPRDKIEVDMNAIGSLLTGKTILITGSAGSIGSEMVRQIAAYAPKNLVLVDQAETPQHCVRLEIARRWPQVQAHTIMASISNSTRMEQIFKTYRPDYVFHAAAYKHVPMMEDNPSESIQNNVHGTQIVADLAVKYGTKKFVMISTDKAVNPTNVMGCSKRICEIYVQSLDRAIKEGEVKGTTQFVTTRFGNVLGSNGSVIPLFKEQIRNGGPVTVTHPDIVRFFMLIPEACKLVLEAGTKGNGGEIFVFDMGKSVRIADLAKRMIKLSGAKGIEIKYTGLRDGEKLYEEVLNDEEITKPTFHPKIKIAQVREYDYKKVCEDLKMLLGLSYQYEDMNMVAQMKLIVPEFKSQHSKYEVLDKKQPAGKIA